MRIAQIGPIVERTPPKKYGGTERIVSALTEELVRRGHDVTLFASGDSVTSARLISIYPRALSEIKIRDLFASNSLSMFNIGLAYSRQDQFDVIHDHTGTLGLPTANLSTKPVVITMHGPFRVFDKNMYGTLNKPYVVPISNSQKISDSRINYAETIYHGLPLNKYPFKPDHDGFLLFVGRFSPEKGAHYAIEIANYLNMPLILAAKVESDINNPDRKYFYDFIEPKLSETIRYVGQVDEEERNRLMSEAKCLLNPISWKEPFGLVMIEAMATGCPVIAFNSGSAPEVVKDGVSGYIVRDIEEMIDAVLTVEELDREKIREYALTNFSVERMTDQYEKLYERITNS